MPISSKYLNFSQFPNNGVYGLTNEEIRALLGIFTLMSRSAMNKDELTSKENIVTKPFHVLAGRTHSSEILVLGLTNDSAIINNTLIVNTVNPFDTITIERDLKEVGWNDLALSFDIFIRINLSVLVENKLFLNEYLHKGIEVIEEMPVPLREELENTLNDYLKQVVERRNQMQINPIFQT